MQRFYLTPSQKDMPFHGAKLALHIGGKLAVILRDASPAIPYPGHWDLPGGGREGVEDPLTCALRETREELGLTLPPEVVQWGRAFGECHQVKWFFAARLPASIASQIVLGDEGQRWCLMPPSQYLSHPLAIPQFRNRLSLYLAERLSPEKPPAAFSGGR